MFNDLDKFINELRGYVEQVHSNAIKAVEESLKLVEGTSQKYVPVKSGDLRDSFFTEIKVTKNRIVGVAGYDREGRLSKYAKIMHEGMWPQDFWPNQLSHLNGTEINYHTDYQPTPKAHFLKLGFVENDPQIRKLLEGIFNV